MPEASLVVNEIFYSIQGESTRAGLPCVFVRLTGCHLRCHYCDTEYAFHEGARRSIRSILDEVAGYACPLVELTGGEPLLQPAAPRLMRELADRGDTVLVETSGSLDISVCDPRVIRIMDMKCPGSGESGRNDPANLGRLGAQDEVKFVLASRADYVWAREMVVRERLAERVAAVLFAPVHEVPAGRHVAGSAGLALDEVAAWILADRLPVRLQTQLHKQIWDPARRGV